MGANLADHVHHFRVTVILIRFRTEHGSGGHIQDTASCFTVKPADEGYRCVFHHFHPAFGGIDASGISQCQCEDLAFGYSPVIADTWKLPQAEGTVVIYDRAFGAHPSE